MKTLPILNDPPYGTDLCYNALPRAHALLKRDPGAEMTIFLVADAVGAPRRFHAASPGSAAGLPPGWIAGRVIGISPGAVNR